MYASIFLGLSVFSCVTYSALSYPALTASLITSFSSIPIFGIALFYQGIYPPLVCFISVFLLHYTIVMVKLVVSETTF